MSLRSFLLVISYPFANMCSLMAHGERLDKDTKEKYQGNEWTSDKPSEECHVRWRRGPIIKS